MKENLMPGSKALGNAPEVFDSTAYLLFNFFSSSDLASYN